MLSSLSVVFIVAKNPGVQYLCIACLQFFGGAYPEVELLRYAVILSFQGAPVLFFVSPASFQITTLAAQGSDVSTSSPTLGVF